MGTKVRIKKQNHTQQNGIDRKKCKENPLKYKKECELQNMKYGGGGGGGGVVEGGGAGGGKDVQNKNFVTDDKV